MTVQALGNRASLRPAMLAAVIICIGAAVTSGILVALTGSALPLLAASAAALGLILVLRPDIGTLLFLGLLWINAPAVVSQFHGVPGFIAGAVALLLVVPVARPLLQRDPIVITPTFFALLFFVAANLLSAATSSNPVLALDAVIVLLGEGLLIYVLVSNAVRTPEMARLAVLVLVCATVVMAGISLHQELTEAYRDPYLGFAQTSQQEGPANLRPDPDARPRLTGPVGEQNRYAQVLLVIVPLALFGMRIRHPLWGRVVPLGAGLLVIAGVLLTFSRGAAVALALLLAALVVWRYVRLRHMLALIAAVALTIVVVAPEFIGRVGSIATVAGLVSDEGDEPDGAILGRTTSNLAALLVFVDYPVAGVGPGVYVEDYSATYANELGLRYFDTTRRAHNMYLEWAADLGVLGLTAGVAMIGFTLVHLARLRSFWLPRRADYGNLAGAFSLAILLYAATAVFLHLSYMRYFFVLLALANSVIWILERERRQLGDQVKQPPARGHGADGASASGRPTPSRQPARASAAIEPVGEAEVLARL